MKAFLDANILFSAANSQSNIHRFVRFLSSRRAAISSVYAAEEARRNILAKKPDWSDGYKKVMQGIKIVSSVDGDLGVSIAKKDRPIIATAVRECCDYLVTGDYKDFGHLFGKTIGGTKIVSVPMMREALKALQ